MMHVAADAEHNEYILYGGARPDLRTTQQTDYRQANRQTGNQTVEEQNDQTTWQ